MKNIMVSLAIAVMFASAPVGACCYLESKERTVAHRQGVAAGRAGVPYDANPYNDGVRSHTAAWLEGWCEGHREDK